ncbi:nesprin-3-like [Chanos chanos]|uniref:Nesprin-3-like n=1 Tax=Chanos chanos TaxID=29144 RepID=A0A6J2V6D5_CHACN|nr:nesprin-3-like [Chanos chanos]
MTQQEQDEFDQSLDSALCWIKQIQTRLESNDNTQGPMEALEGRVRETEEICEFEHEGIARVDMVLSASKPLIQNGSEETRAETRSKLRELKTLWEETSTYIIHCHSRVKWVWLHWCEYVRAYEGFWSWLTKVHSEVMRYPELQLGTREKLWQLDQHRVLLIDIQHHAEPLERLLDEAATLHSKTQDPSLEPQAMENLQDVYRQVLHKAQERVATLEKIVEEQQTYNSSVQNFQAWLATQNHELNQYLEDEKSTEDKNSTLQEIFEKVSGKEELLQQMEHVAEEVKACSSPDGSLQVVREMEALRQAWEGLRERVLQEKESKRSSMLSQQALVSQCEELHEEVTRLHAIVKSLNQQLKELEEDTQSRRENNMARDWQQTVNVYNMVTSEGPRVEQLKIRLGELIKQSRNATSIFNEVLAVIKEFHGVKHRASKLFLEMKSNFHQSLQDLFQDFSQWRQKATKFLEMSEESAEISHIAMLMKSIEVKMKESKQNVKEHEDFKENLLDLNKWMVGIRRRLDTFCDATGECRVEDCRIDAEVRKFIDLSASCSEPEPEPEP